MTPDNFLPAPAGMTRRLAAFFDQFERASPGFVPIMSLADHAASVVDLEPEPGSKVWWDRQLRAAAIDGKAAAIEFRERMRAENMEKAHD